MTEVNLSPFLALPAELIQQILAHLEEQDLLNITLVCRLLHKHALEDVLWQPFVQNSIHTPASSPAPCSSYRALWSAFRPYWFMTRHKLWVADTRHHGRLVVARYEPRTGAIEAYAVTVQQGAHTFGLLNWNGSIIYHTFNPKVQIDLNRPILSISVADAQAASAYGSNRYATELLMNSRSGQPNQPSSSVFLTRALPPHLTASNTAVWPHRNLPTPNNDRVRNESNASFRATGHKPYNSAEASEAAFRVRQWVHFGPFAPLANDGPSAQLGEVVTTYGTLDPACYAPTKDKPWQGIWCGDYSGHGCEFLVIMQPDEPRPLPEKARRAFALWPDSTVPRWGLHYDDDDEIVADDTEDDFNAPDGLADAAAAATADIEAGAAPAPAAAATSSPARPTSTTTDHPPFKGRLEAVKLTGDPNVPRGEYTFIVDDLGADGLVGYTHEPVFTDPARSAGAAASSADGAGTRIVRAVGHIAGHNFQNEAYIPCQLIVISENRLAQLWIPFGHISFFERVDVGALLASGTGVGEGKRGP